MHYNSHELSKWYLEAFFKISFSSLKAETGKNLILVARRVITLKSHY